MNTIGDLTLGLDSQARAVLTALAAIEAPDGIQCESAAWYNGREQGIVLSARWGYSGPVLHIVVVEARSSDSIALQTWTGQASLNPPTVADLPEHAYRSQCYFPYLAIGEVVQAIQTLLQDSFPAV